MMYKALLAVVGLLAISEANGQWADNAYRNTNNKYYWQNRKPDGAYWQQDVHYKLQAVVREDSNLIEGQEELTYWNNSPDTLRYVYFHLYQNAFVNGSYLHELEKENNVKTKLGPKEAAGLGTVVGDVAVNNQPARTELDNTILKVWLRTPLPPQGKAVITMGFRTYFDNGITRRRMKMYNAWGSMHYNGVQWYPKMSVYDRMHGWDTYQHLNREFYGDYGLFDVTIDVPNNYIVEATGELVNRKEVLPDELRAKLDIKNFANKKWEEAPSIIIPYEKGKRKQWRFSGNNVHDFAFTADPSYRIGTEYWNGVECVAIVQEPHASKWQNATGYIAKIIKTFSEDIGMYCYPKIVAADAADGMEYPMITLDGGGDPGYRGLLTHEIAHNWFYGQVGSNETYRAAMDEGFTQFLTAWGLRRIDGEQMVSDPQKSRWRRKYTEPDNVLDRNVLNRYTHEALNQDGLSINTHSDDFRNSLNHGGGYGAVYYKTATMLYNLQYTLGDTLFLAAMQHYFDQWKFAHPYFEDFRASIINYTHVDLSWFFDQWFETTKALDYSIGSIKKIKGTDSFAIKFRRRADMQMPIDFTVTAKDGNQKSFYIPNTWFEKSTQATTLPRWYGYSGFRPTYTAHIQMPGGIKKIQIDTTYRLADRNMTDNYASKSWPVNCRNTIIKLDKGLAPKTDRRHYRLDYRPDLWWNPVDGIKAGLHIEGDYLATLYKVDATIWWNSHQLQYDNYLSFKNEGTYDRYAAVNYSFNYSSPITRNMPKLQLLINSRMLDGLSLHKAGLNWQVDGKNTLLMYAQSMWRPNGYAIDYLLTPADWSSTNERRNSSLNAAWSHNYSYLHGAGRYTVSVRAPFMGGNTAPFDYSYGQLESINYNYLGKLEIRTRIFARYGMGNRLPYESILYAAGANPEELMENKYTRSIGIVPTDWQGISRYDIGHFQQGGGLNLRGYAGYYMPDERNGAILSGYKGRSGAAVNLEVGIDKYMPWKPKLLRNWLHADIYAFGDAGIMELSNIANRNVFNIAPAEKLGNLHVDAGLGMALTIKKWGVFDKAKPLTLRLDLPFFLNRPTYNNPQYTTIRYVVGINRAF